MASASGIPVGEPVAPVYVAASGPTPGSGPQAPVPRGDRFVLPQNHFQYAMTWFAFAATLAAVYFVHGLRRPTSAGTADDR